MKETGESGSTKNKTVILLLIILDGDMLNEDSKSDEVLVRLVKGLAEIAPVYYALGNHELDYIGTAEGKKMQKHPENSELVKDLTDAGACVLEEGYRDVEIGGCMNMHLLWMEITVQRI